jgi:quercetin dioxygenase-like cupin family protein
MRFRVVLLTALLLIAGAAFAPGMRGAAVETTPAGAGIANVKVALLGSGMSAGAPGYVLLLSRLTFAPGGSIALHTHPGDAVFFVESGRITWTTGAGTPLLTRAGAATATGTPTAPEALAVGEEVVLEPGDAVFYDGQTSHAVRNDGAEDAVVLYSGLRAADQPGISFLEATPAP